MAGDPEGRVTEDPTSPAPLGLAVQELSHDGLAWAARGAERVRWVPASRASGRILADDLVARADQPSLDDSALDGVACHAEDVTAASPRSPVRLRIVGESVAGRPFGGRVDRGEAVRVQTGAGVPDGADAVVGVEHLVDEGSAVSVTAPASRDAVRRRGRSVRAGQVGLRAGRRLDAAALALVATLGHDRVPVAPRPRVGLLVTGDELVDPGAPLGPGRTYDGNAPALAALVRAAGAIPVPFARVGDGEGALEERLAAAGTVDLLVSSGGISMGRYDRVRDHLTRHGEIVFRRVLVKPGGPATFARVGALPWLALPGNPVSVLVTFLLLGRAWIDRATGRTGPLPMEATLPAWAAGTMSAAGAKTTLLRVRLERRGDRMVAAPLADQDSAVVASLAYGDALAILPPHAQLGEGDPVEVVPLGPHLG